MPKQSLQKSLLEITAFILNNNIIHNIFYYYVKNIMKNYLIILMVSNIYILGINNISATMPELADVYVFIVIETIKQFGRYIKADK